MGLTEKLTDIKSQADALISYANETTGADDTRLGDAVKTLVDGFGGSMAENWELVGQFETDTISIPKSYKKLMIVHDNTAITGSQTYWKNAIFFKNKRIYRSNDGKTVFKGYHLIEDFFNGIKTTAMLRNYNSEPRFYPTEITYEDTNFSVSDITELTYQNYNGLNPETVISVYGLP